MAGQHVRGIILAPVGDHGDFLGPRRRTLPTVTIDRSISGFDSVIVDDLRCSAARGRETDLQADTRG